MNLHLVLVPGFGGFDALGTLRYYEGVTRVLEETPLVLHYFPNLPTASVRTRAEQMLSFLDERWRRKEIRSGDEIHLVGHSTGGLDLRQLLLRYRELEGSKELRRADSTLEVLSHIRSVQFLSTPQRGTNLVRRMNQPLVRSLLIRPLLRAFFESTRALRERGTSVSARLLRRVLLRGKRLESANWIDALLDTMEGCYSREGAHSSALARASYFELLRWLLHMASDSSALSDLSPVHLGDAPPSPAHSDDPEGERRFLVEHGIRYASIVTVARPKSEHRFDLFNQLHALTAESPVARLGPPRAVRKLLDPRTTQMLLLSDNDGLVNTVSQVWPDAASCYLVDADHADVIGHYQAETAGDTHGALKRYDLLNSASGFDAEAFLEVWTRIASFAQGQSYAGSDRAPRRSSAAPG
jgi:triacylglycerol lipase